MTVKEFQKLIKGVVDYRYVYHGTEYAQTDECKPAIRFANNKVVDVNVSGDWDGGVDACLILGEVLHA